MCADGVAFSGPGSDPAADGASLRHPGAQAGIIWGGRNWRGGRRRGRGGQLLGLWEWRGKRQHLLQLRGNGLFVPEHEADALFEHFIEESVYQEKLCALKCLLSQHSPHLPHTWRNRRGGARSSAISHQIVFPTQRLSLFVCRWRWKKSISKVSTR